MKRRKQRKIAAYLDAKLPLAGASHADVERYFIDTPMRYTQCFAALTDGRVVKLRDSRQFVGWHGDEQSRSLLFCCNGRRMVINAVNGSYDLEDPSQAIGVRKFIGRDGSLIFVRRWGRELANAASEHISHYALPRFEPTGATI